MIVLERNKESLSKRMTRRAQVDNNMWRRPTTRMMVVPSSESEWLEAPVYELNCNNLLEDVVINRASRPLPSSTVLASLAPATQGLDMPLLQHLRPLMKGNESTETISDTKTDAQNTSFTDAIDDSSSCSLTRGQHARYLQLKSGSESWNEGRRKEFSKLHKRVKQEQELYRQALETFWQQHLQRFKVGLESTVARYCQSFAKMYQSSYESSSSSPQYFGPCSQVISLQHVSFSAFTKSITKRDSKLTLDAISSEVVHHEIRGDEPIVIDFDTADPLAFTEANMPSLQLLQNDSLAMRLSNEYGASIVTTKETLESLLQVSGDESTRWMIPATKNDSDTVVLDTPLPQPTIPRECVSQGVTEGLNQSLSQSVPSSDGGYTYTLLTLPSRASGKSRCKVLVRSRRRLYNNEQEPLCIRTHLEYFPSRGTEEFTSCERSTWMLDSLLKEQTKMARVNPSTMKILQWEQVGVAHALAFPKNHAITTIEMDPMHHLEALVTSLHSFETLAVGHHLLRLSPLSTSISVHTACLSETDEKSIHVTEELNKADAVYTGAAALRQCARLWQWKEDRIPYTFPISEKSKCT